MAAKREIEVIAPEEQFRQITEHMLETFICKNHDYGNSFEQSCEEFGTVAAVVRMNDKMNRIKSLYDHSEMAKVNEKLEDTLLDLANYCILTTMYIRKHKV